MTVGRKIDMGKNETNEQDLNTICIKENIKPVEVSCVLDEMHGCGLREHATNHVLPHMPAVRHFETALYPKVCGRNIH